MVVEEEEAEAEASHEEAEKINKEGDPILQCLIQMHLTQTLLSNQIHVEAKEEVDEAIEGEVGDNTSYLKIKASISTAGSESSRTSMRLNTQADQLTDR